MKAKPKDPTQQLVEVLLLFARYQTIVAPPSRKDCRNVVRALRELADWIESSYEREEGVRFPAVHAQGTFHAGFYTFHLVTQQAIDHAIKENPSLATLANIKGGKK